MIWKCFSNLAFVTGIFHKSRFWHGQESNLPEKWLGASCGQKKHGLCSIYSIQLTFTIARWTTIQGGSFSLSLCPARLTSSVFQAETSDLSASLAQMAVTRSKTCSQLEYNVHSCDSNQRLRTFPVSQNDCWHSLSHVHGFIPQMEREKKEKKKHNDTLPPVTGPTVYTLVSFSSSSTLPTRFCCGGPQQNKGKGGQGDLPFITFLSRAEWREARARRRDAVFMFQGHMRVFYIYQLCQTSHVCLPFWKHLQWDSAVAQVRGRENLRSHSDLGV